MPYQIKKVGSKYKLFNLFKKEFVRKAFKSRESAISAGKNYMRYSGEKPIVKGNKIISK